MSARPACRSTHWQGCYWATEAADTLLLLPLMRCPRSLNVKKRFNAARVVLLETILLATSSGSFILPPGKD